MERSLLFLVAVGVVLAATGMSAQMHGGSGQMGQRQSQGGMQGGQQGGTQGGTQGAGPRGMGVPALCLALAIHHVVRVHTRLE